MTTQLPPAVLNGVTGALARLGLATSVCGATPASGGCINHGARIDTEAGASFFLKWNAKAPPRLFEAEADGLRALAAAGTLRVPQPIARGGGSKSPSWLLMEYVPPEGSPAPDFDERLGRGLALLHRSTSPWDVFGWSRGNWIGSLPQSNRDDPSWSSFWRDQRILPQLERAKEGGHFGPAELSGLDRLVEVIPEALEDVDRALPHLLHGDLWSGNTYATSGGEPVLIDPAVYRGHGEVDLAMAELFGGFGPAFHAAYAEVEPISEAYRRYRRELYQLYYLLVHVNLFGAQYAPACVSAARRVVDAVGSPG